MRDPPRILVADDNPDNVAILKTRLESVGYEVVAAADGQQALAQVEATQPDLILLDIMMPKMDGLEVCRRIKNDPRVPFIPIVIITAKSDSRDVADGLDSGADEFLTKPVDHTALLARVRSMLRIKALHEQLAERNRLLELLSRQDGLTGLANRRSFDEALREELPRAARERSHISLILGDVDCFKGFNDRYGHVAGDDCLRKVASAFAAACRRPADLAARYGGEEFALILPDTPPEGAQGIAELLRQSIERLSIPHAASTAAAHVSISLGIAASSSGRIVTPEQLTACADQALYRAKEQGRNRCATFAAGQD